MNFSLPWPNHDVLRINKLPTYDPLKLWLRVKMSKPETENPPSYVVSTQPVLTQPVPQVQYVQQVQVVQETGRIKNNNNFYFLNLYPLLTGFTTIQAWTLPVLLWWLLHGNILLLSRKRYTIVLVDWSTTQAWILEPFESWPGYCKGPRWCRLVMVLSVCLL